MNQVDEVDRLAAHARQGDERSFEALVRALVRPALAAAWEFVPTREDAEEIVQDTFTRAWRQIDRYDVTRPFAPWFFTILRNVARNAARRDRRWDPVPLTDEIGQLLESTGGEADPLHEMESADRIHAALAELSPMQRACFRLTEIEGFTSAEASVMLGVNDATVRVHAHRAKKSLRARLGVERSRESS